MEKTLQMIAAIDYPYLPTLVAALLAFLLGFVWYSPKLMGEKWMKARGMTGVGFRADARQFAVSFLLWLLSSCFYSFLVMFLDVDTVPALLSFSCLVWVAFSLPPSLMGALYTGGTFEAVAIEAAYHLAGYYLFAVAHIGFMTIG